MVLPSTTITAEDAPEVSQLRPAQSPKFAHNDYARFLARCTTLRNIDGIRGLIPYELQPGLISLLAGKPNPQTFPIEDISLTVRSPAGPQPYQSSASESAIVRETLVIKNEDLATALQYTFTDGIPELRKLLSNFQTIEHGVNIDDVGLQLTMGSGSQDLLYKAFSSLLDPGDSVLVEAPAYAGVLAILQPLEADLIEVESDPSGLSISHLRSTLESWPVGKRLPKAIYTVPFGCNPSGATTTLERRKGLLELAEEYDFLILEDDPYFYLYFGSDERPPSYLSLENTLMKNAGVNKRQRRVLRFDSFSKVFSGGMRIGFLTGPPALLKPINSHTSAANLQAATTTQSMVLAILKHWGHSGFRAHISNISDFYRGKRDVFHEAMKKHFGNGLAEWTKPEAGLFFWFKLNLPPSKSDSYHLIRTQALAKGVLAVPGTAFYPSGRKSAYVRAAFSLVDKQDADEALRRLAEVVKEAMNVDKGENEQN
ncbi:aminotransferase class I and II protein [Ceratobasidium sp. AG-Ba]|nr:aminotransferase class I and II protein [Ceratobasidium sp. AG-Ba]